MRVFVPIKARQTAGRAGAGMPAFARAEREGDAMAALLRMVVDATYTLSSAACSSSLFPPLCGIGNV